MIRSSTKNNGVHPKSNNVGWYLVQHKITHFWVPLPRVVSKLVKNMLNPMWKSTFDTQSVEHSIVSQLGQCTIYKGAEWDKGA